MIPLYAKLTEKAIGTADCDKIVRISFQKVKMILLYSGKRFAPLCPPHFSKKIPGQSVGDLMHTKDNQLLIGKAYFFTLRVAEGAEFPWLKSTTIGASSS